MNEKSIQDAIRWPLSADRRFKEIGKRSRESSSFLSSACLVGDLRVAAAPTNKSDRSRNRSRAVSLFDVTHLPSVPPFLFEISVSSEDNTWDLLASLCHKWLTAPDRWMHVHCEWVTQIGRMSWWGRCGGGDMKNCDFVCCDFNWTAVTWWPHLFASFNCRDCGVSEDRWSSNGDAMALNWREFTCEKMEIIKVQGKESKNKNKRLFKQHVKWTEEGKCFTRWQASDILLSFILLIMNDDGTVVVPP